MISAMQVLCSRVFTDTFPLLHKVMYILRIALLSESKMKFSLVYSTHKRKQVVVAWISAQSFVRHQRIFIN